MFIETLPYSKQLFTIPVITFKDIFELSRLVYDKNQQGIVNYINRIFNIENLNIIDKFFVIIKARQFYINETVSLNLSDKPVSLNVSNFANCLYDIETKHTVIDLVDKQIEIDLPFEFITNSNFNEICEKIIKKVTIGVHNITLTGCKSDNIQSLLELFPPSAMTQIKKFIICPSHNIEIFSSKVNQNDSISLNFLTSQPYDMILSLLGEYDLISCREILFALSKRINSETILNSPVCDITSYMSQYQDEIKRDNDSGNNKLNL